MVAELSARPGTPRRGRLVAAGVVVLLALAAAGYLLVRDGAGPLGLGDSDAGSSALALQDLVTGEPYTYGFIVENGGDEDAVLDSVELVGDADGVTVGPAAAGVGGDTVASARGFPPPGLDVVPVRGARVAAGDHGNVLVRVVVTQPGIHRFSGARVHYAVGGHEYTYDVPDDLMLCSSTCPPR
jgi:hypothetical protein